jgi:hypothetical protein
MMRLLKAMIIFGSWLVLVWSKYMVLCLHKAQFGFINIFGVGRDLYVS